jgi:hypothetical protein
MGCDYRAFEDSTTVAAALEEKRHPDQKTTLNAPFVTVRVPLLPLAGSATMVNWNVPVADPGVSVVIVMLPLPPPALLCQVWPEDPTVRRAFVGSLGPIG